MLIFDTVTFELPAFVRVTLICLLFPTATFPKFKLGLLVARNAVGDIPIPLKETVFAKLEPSLETETLPDKMPGVFGEKTRLKLDWLPGAIVAGREIPEILIPAALVLTCVIVRFVPPLFEMVTDWDPELPTGTSPKPIDAGSTETAAGVPGTFCSEATFGPPAVPVQPEMERIAKSNRAKGIAVFFSERGYVASFLALLKFPLVTNLFIANDCQF